MKNSLNFVNTCLRVVDTRRSEIANQAGTDPDHLVKNAALRLLERDSRYRAAVRKGLEQADRGDFVDGVKMEARH